MDSNHRSPVAIGQVRTPEGRSSGRKYLHSLHSLGLGVLFNAGLPRGTGSSNPPLSCGESGANLIFRGESHRGRPCCCFGCAATGESDGALLDNVDRPAAPSPPRE